MGHFTFTWLVWFGGVTWISVGRVRLLPLLSISYERLKIAASPGFRSVMRGSAFPLSMGFVVVSWSVMPIPAKPVAEQVVVPRLVKVMSMVPVLASGEAFLASTVRFWVLQGPTF